MGYRAFFLNLSGWDGIANSDQFQKAFLGIKTDSSTEYGNDKFIAGGLAGIVGNVHLVETSIINLAGNLLPTSAEEGPHRRLIVRHPRVVRYYSHTIGQTHFYSYIFVKRGVPASAVGYTFLYKREGFHEIAPEYYIGTETTTDVLDVQDPPANNKMIITIKNSATEEDENVTYHRCIDFPAIFHIKLTLAKIDFSLAFVNNTYSGENIKILTDLLGDAIEQISSEYQNCPVILGGTIKINPETYRAGALNTNLEYGYPIGYTHFGQKSLLNKGAKKTTNAGVEDFWICSTTGLTGKDDDAFSNMFCYVHDIMRESKKFYCLSSFSVRLCERSAISMQIMGPDNQE